MSWKIEHKTDVVHMTGKPLCWDSESQTWTEEGMLYSDAEMYTVTKPEDGVWKQVRGTDCTVISFETSLFLEDCLPLTVIVHGVLKPKTIGELRKAYEARTRTVKEISSTAVIAECIDDVCRAVLSKLDIRFTILEPDTTIQGNIDPL